MQDILLLYKVEVKYINILLMSYDYSLHIGLSVFLLFCDFYCFCCIMLIYTTRTKLRNTCIWVLISYTDNDLS